MEQTIRWSDWKRQHPKVRIREAAKQLGVAEAALLATECGAGVVRLAPRWLELLPRVVALGPVKTITRNDSCVLERIGAYADLELSEHGGTAVGPIDLRLFLGAWQKAFAVTETSRDRALRSLQFFDGFGDAVHKIYLEPTSNEAAFEALIADFRAADQETREVCAARPAPKIDAPDATIDREALRAAWDAMQDTHEFFGMLRKLGAGRLQALRLAGDERARRVAVDLDALGEAIVTAELPIMIFVGNRGLLQIYTGPIGKLVRTGPWFNVLDPEFNLHLLTEKIAQAWVVKKPTRDGIVTSLELFDAAGEVIALWFGERKPGRPELLAWRALVATLAAAS